MRLSQYARDRYEKDPRFLKKTNIGNVHGLNLFCDTLEQTFLIRAFAEFEATLRDFWREHLKRTSAPRMRDLIESIAKKRSVKSTMEAHKVRDYRNFLIHGGPMPSPVSLPEGCRIMKSFMSHLPPKWA